MNKPQNTSELLKPFFSAPVPADMSSMSDVIKSKLSEAAERLGYRDGKQGVTVPPSEWSDDRDDIQTALRRAWARGCESGMRVRQNYAGHRPRNERKL